MPPLLVTDSIRLQERPIVFDKPFNSSGELTVKELLALYAVAGPA